MEAKIGGCNMKKLAILIILCNLTLCTYAKYSGGTGKQNDPYLISTPEDLQYLSDYYDGGGYFKMVNDIDLSGFPLTPIEQFGREFDGNGYAIHNYEPTNPCSSIGLFGYMTTGKIKNLTLVNPFAQCLIYSETDVGLLVDTLYRGQVTNCHVVAGHIEKIYPWPPGVYNFSVGGLVGRIYDEGTVDNCSIIDTVVIGVGAGGIAGENRGAIRNCFAFNVDADGGYSSGGICGSNLGEILECAAHGNIYAKTSAGGLIGSIPGPPAGHRFNPVVRQCYAFCTVSSGYYSGGFV